MKIKTNEATPNQINYLVAKCEGIHVSMARGGWFVFDSDAWAEFRNDYNDDKLQPFKPSTNWAQGGPIIEREELSNLKCYGTNDWGCNNGDIFCDGPTPLIAAMRCYVTCKLGDEVEIPEEFI